MGIRIYREPELENPDLIACWPGIGNIGIIAIDTLMKLLATEEFGEIEAWDFFYPTKVSIEGGLLTDLEFPRSKFLFCRTRIEEKGTKDLIFFIGERQPSDGTGMYAFGEKAWNMANLILDFAQNFGCQRVYTSGACVSPIHHEMKPRVVAVVSSEKLIKEVRGYPNTFLMSEIAERESEGMIAGLNGSLLRVAKERGLEGICLMGEIPDWLAAAPFVYPKASRSILEVLADIIGIEIDLGILDHMIWQTEKIIEQVYEKLPPEVKEILEQRKSISQEEIGPITDEDVQWITDHLEELFSEEGDEEDEEKSI